MKTKARSRSERLHIILYRLNHPSKDGILCLLRHFILQSPLPYRFLKVNGTQPSASIIPKHVQSTVKTIFILHYYYRIIRVSFCKLKDQNKVKLPSTISICWQENIVAVVPDFSADHCCFPSNSVDEYLSHERLFKKHLRFKHGVSPEVWQLPRANTTEAATQTNVSTFEQSLSKNGPADWSISYVFYKWQTTGSLCIRTDFLLSEYRDITIFINRHKGILSNFGKDTELRIWF